jgi:thioredoxin reductase (NADPH)
MQYGPERYGAETAFVEVRGLDLKSAPKHIITSVGDYYARTVAIARFVARKLGLEGEDKLVGYGLAYCATGEGMKYK